VIYPSSAGAEVVVLGRSRLLRPYGYYGHRGVKAWKPETIAFIPVSWLGRRTRTCQQRFSVVSWFPSLVRLGVSDIFPQRDHDTAWKNVQSAAGSLIRLEDVRCAEKRLTPQPEQIWIFVYCVTDAYQLLKKDLILNNTGGRKKKGWKDAHIVSMTRTGPVDDETLSWLDRSYRDLCSLTCIWTKLVLCARNSVLLLLA